MGNADSQFRALAIIPKITSSVSIPCQAWIVKEIYRDHQRKRGRATSRALLGMGVIDMCASFGWFLSTWAVPQDTPGVPYAVGNTATCTFQGFLLQLAIGAPMYNCLLGLFYMLTIRHGWSEARLRRWEYVLHSFIVLFAAGTSVALVPLGVYNHIGAVCWVMGKPQGCGNSNYDPSDIPCERGSNAWIYGVALFYGPLWVCILFTTMAMVLIYAKVRNTERQSERYAGAPSVRKSKGVFIQAILYTAAFYITWLPSTLWSVTQWVGAPMFWLDLLATICEPSQGLLNLLVFVRPRKDLRRKLKRDLLMLFSCGLYRGDQSAMLDGSSSKGASQRSEDSLRMNRISMLNLQGNSVGGSVDQKEGEMKMEEGCVRWEDSNGMNGGRDSVSSRMLRMMVIAEEGGYSEDDEANHSARNGEGEPSSSSSSSLETSGKGIGNDSNTKPIPEAYDGRMSVLNINSLRYVLSLPGEKDDDGTEEGDDEELESTASTAGEL